MKNKKCKHNWKYGNPQTKYLFDTIFVGSYSADMCIGLEKFIERFCDKCHKFEKIYEIL